MQKAVKECCEELKTFKLDVLEKVENTIIKHLTIKETTVVANSKEIKEKL